MAAMEPRAEVTNAVKDARRAMIGNAVAEFPRGVRNYAPIFTSRYAITRPISNTSPAVPMGRIAVATALSSYILFPIGENRKPPTRRLSLGWARNDVPELALDTNR